MRDVWEWYRELTAEKKKEATTKGRKFYEKLFHGRNSFGSLPLSVEWRPLLDSCTKIRTYVLPNTSETTADEFDQQAKTQVNGYFVILVLIFFAVVKYNFYFMADAIFERVVLASIEKWAQIREMLRNVGLMQILAKRSSIGVSEKIYLFLSHLKFYAKFGLIYMATLINITKFNGILALARSLHLQTGEHQPAGQR